MAIAMVMLQVREINRIPGKGEDDMRVHVTSSVT